MKRALIGIVLALTACGSGATTSGTTSQAPQTAADLATKIGCTGYTQSSEEMYVKEGGDCTLNGQTVYVNTYADDTARDQYLEVAKSTGGTYAQGPKWVIHGDDATTIEQAAKTAGGQLTP